MPDTLALTTPLLAILAMGRRSSSDDAGHLNVPPSAPAVEANFDLRPLNTRADYRACVELQLETWGTEFNEVVPPTLLKIGQRVGGVAAGAFGPSGELLGFVFGLTGVERGRIVHWSHMLAVREAARDRGIGRRLKEYQRALLRSQGGVVAYWTFDPLVARNAHLNLNRLGAEVDDYVVDMYGETASELHRGLGTDRFVVAWEIAGDRDGGHERSPAVLDVQRYAGAPAVNAVLTPDGRLVPVDLPLGAIPVVRVEVPADIHEVKAASPEAAVAWRMTTRRAFTWYFERGYRVAGFYRDGAAGREFYLLSAGGSAKEA